MRNGSTGSDGTAVLAVRDPTRRALLRDAIAAAEGLDVDVEEVSSMDTIRTTLRDCDHAVYLIDADLDGDEGRTVLALAEAYECHAALLFLLDAPDPDVELRLLRQGATACLAPDRRRPGTVGHAVRKALARVEAEASRLRSGKRFRALIENAQDIITVLDGNGVIRYESPTIERVLGYGVEELVGRTAFDYIHADDAESVFDTFLEGVKQPASTATMQYRFRHRDGSWRMLESRAKNLLDDPMVEGIVINSRDVTDRTRAEVALRESERKFRDLFENSPDAIFVESLEGLVLDVNPAACRLHAREREGLVGRSVFDLVPPPHEAHVREQFKRMADGEVDYLEGFSWTAEDEAVPVEIRARRIMFGKTPALLLHVRDVTERRAAEEALRRSEMQNRAIVDALPDALVRLDRNGVYLEVRLPSDYEAFVEPEELLGKVSYDLLPGAVADQARACVEQALDTGVMQTFEYEIDVGDERRVREGRVVPCGEDEVISIQRDITERKRAEEEVQRLKAFYAQVLDDLPADVAVMDPGGRILYLNAFSVRDPEMRQWLIGRTAFDYCRRRNLDPGIARQRQAQIQRAVTERRVVRFEESFPARDGGERHILRIASPVIDADGAVQQVIGYGLDITERKRAEDALRRSEALLRTVVANVPVMLFAFDRNGVFSLAEGKGLGMFGVEPGMLVGRAVHDVDGMIPGLAGFVDRALSGDAFSTTVEEVGRAVEAWFSPLLDRNDTVRGVICVAADITDLKRSEQELKRSREQLRELAQHLQSIREAERTRISREVHDVLGQSLTAIRMEVSWIEKGLQSDQQTLQQRVDALKDMIDETVQTVRRIAAELRPGVLDDLGLAAALDWQAQEFARRTNIEVTFCDDLGDVQLDRNRSTAIFRVYQEILTNVARHAKASRVDVHLRRDDGWLILQVRDDGIGIETEDLADTKSLGLLGMRERTQAWGGEVIFRGAPGEGTTVVVRLPLPAEAP